MTAPCLHLVRSRDTRIPVEVGPDDTVAVFDETPTEELLELLSRHAKVIVW